MTRALEDRIGYAFKDQALLDRALTHASAAKNGKSYERLEFLGDRVLGFVIAEILYRDFPKETEGALAKRLNDLVKKDTLKKVADDIGLDKTTIRSDSKQTVTPSVTADVMEAVIAGIYLDGGFEAARKFIEKHWKKYIREKAKPPEDDKSKLQEWAQSRGIALPRYKLVERSGPDHKPDFVVEVSVSGIPAQQGHGATKQDAEKVAAQSLYLYVLKHHD